MVVPASDKTAAARFFADLVGLPVSDSAGPFVPVRVNGDLTLDFAERHDVAPGHYAFLVDDDTFDRVVDHLGRIPAIDYGSGPEHGWDRRINHLAGGRGVYVRDPDGHSYEVFTVVP